MSVADGCILRTQVLHSGDGNPLKGATMKTTIEKIGVTEANSVPRVRNDDLFSEAPLDTCKYVPNWHIKGFATKAVLHAWVKSFASWYNWEHLYRSICFVTPSVNHTGLDFAALAKRSSPYLNAQGQNPERRSCKTLYWEPVGPVWLNTANEIIVPEIGNAA